MVNKLRINPEAAFVASLIGVAEAAPCRIAPVLR
jgi:hypothetical protein